MNQIRSRSGKRVTSKDLRKEDANNKFMRTAGIHGMGTSSGKSGRKTKVVTPDLDAYERKATGSYMTKSGKRKRRGNGDPTNGPG